MVLLLASIMLFSPASPDTQVQPLLKAQEDHVKSQIPDVLKDVAPKESPTSMFQNYLTTGNQMFKDEAGKAMTKLTQFAGGAAQAASKTASFLSGTDTYKREDFLNTAPVNIPNHLREPIMQNTNDLVTPSIFGRMLAVENAPADIHAVRHNRDGSKDMGLFQINSTNVPWIQKQFKADGSIFDPFNAHDNAKAAALLLKDNADKFKLSIGRAPTDDELLGTYHLGLNEIIKAVKGDMAAQKKEEAYAKKAKVD